MTTISTAEQAVPAVPAGHGLGHVIRRLGWGVADQGMSSLSNFALGLFVARTFGAAGFGAFALAYLTYTVVLNASRGLATDPLLVRHSGDIHSRWRRATEAATGTALVVGVLAGATCVVGGLLLPDPLGPVFVALGVGMPGLALQDSWRFAFFAHGRGRSAFMNDLAWMLLLVLTLVALLASGAGSPATCMLALGATATAAAALGAVQARVLPRVSRAVHWLRTHHQLSVRYLVENVSISGASQLRATLLGAIAGLSAVGYVRASEMLMGPFLVVLMGISQVAVPEASRVLRRDSGHLARFCLLLGGFQAAAALIWGLILITVFPFGPGATVLDDLWAPTSQLIPAITITVAAASFSTAATAGLRAMGAARRSLRSQLTAAAAYAIGGTIGAILGGAVGSSWGVTVAVCLSALVWWHQLRAALREHHMEVAL